MSEPPTSKIERPHRLGATGCLAYAVALIPPGYCVYAWISGQPLRLEQHASTVALHASLLVSALLFVVGGWSPFTVVNGGEDEESLGQMGVWDQLRANWWSLALLLPAVGYGATELTLAAIACVLDPEWGAGVSGGSGLLSWFLMTATLFVLGGMLEATPMWMSARGLRPSKLTLIDWPTIQSYTRKGRYMTIYLRGARDLPYATLVLDETHGRRLASALDEHGVEAWARDPRAFLVVRLAIASVSIGMCSAAAAVHCFELADPRWVFVSLIVLG